MASLKKLKFTKFSSVFLLKSFSLILIICSIALFANIFFKKQSEIENSILNSQRIEVLLNKNHDFEKPKKQIKAKHQRKKLPENKEEIKYNQQEVSRKTPPYNPSYISKFKIKDSFIGPPMEIEFFNILFQEDVKISKDIQKVELSNIAKNPFIVLIIKGLGLSSSSTNNSFSLPENINLGFSPYSQQIDDLHKEAKKKGHETLLHIPLESDDYSLYDPGPYALVTQSSGSDNKARLRMLLNLVDNYDAVYTESNEIFTKDSKMSRFLIEELKSKNKYLIYGGGYNNFTFVQLAEKMDYPLLVNDYILDEKISRENIYDKLQMLETLAKDRGYAVAMAHPYPLTVDILNEWIDNLDDKNIDLISVSQIVGKKIVQ